MAAAERQLFKIDDSGSVLNLSRVEKLYSLGRIYPGSTILVANDDSSPFTPFKIETLVQLYGAKFPFRRIFPNEKEEEPDNDFLSTSSSDESENDNLKNQAFNRGTDGSNSLSSFSASELSDRLGVSKESETGPSDLLPSDQITIKQVGTSKTVLQLTDEKEKTNRRRNKRREKNKIELSEKESDSKKYVEEAATNSSVKHPVKSNQNVSHTSVILDQKPDLKGNTPIVPLFDLNAEKSPALDTKTVKKAEPKTAIVLPLQKPASSKKKKASKLKQPEIAQNQKTLPNNSHLPLIDLPHIGTKLLNNQQVEQCLSTLAQKIKEVSPSVAMKMSGTVPYFKKKIWSCSICVHKGKPVRLQSVASTAAHLVSSSHRKKLMEVGASLSDFNFWFHFYDRCRLEELSNETKKSSVGNPNPDETIKEKVKNAAKTKQNTANTNSTVSSTNKPILKSNNPKIPLIDLNPEGALFFYKGKILIDELELLWRQVDPDKWEEEGGKMCDQYPRPTCYACELVDKFHDSNSLTSHLFSPNHRTQMEKIGFSFCDYLIWRERLRLAIPGTETVEKAEPETAIVLPQKKTTGSKKGKEKKKKQPILPNDPRVPLIDPPEPGTELLSNHELEQHLSTLAQKIDEVSPCVASLMSEEIMQNRWRCSVCFLKKKAFSLRSAKCAAAHIVSKYHKQQLVSPHGYREQKMKRLQTKLGNASSIQNNVQFSEKSEQNQTNLDFQSTIKVDKVATISQVKPEDEECALPLLSCLEPREIMNLNPNHNWPKTWINLYRRCHGPSAVEVKLIDIVRTYSRWLPEKVPKESCNVCRSTKFMNHLQFLKHLFSFQHVKKLCDLNVEVYEEYFNYWFVYYRKLLEPLCEDNRVWSFWERFTPQYDVYQLAYGSLYLSEFALPGWENATSTTPYPIDVEFIENFDCEKYNADDPSGYMKACCYCDEWLHDPSDVLKHAVSARHLIKLSKHRKVTDIEVSQYIDVIKEYQIKKETTSRCAIM